MTRGRCPRQITDDVYYTCRRFGLEPTLILVHLDDWVVGKKGVMIRVKSRFDQYNWRTMPGDYTFYLSLAWRSELPAAIERFAMAMQRSEGQLAETEGALL